MKYEVKVFAVVQEVLNKKGHIKSSLLKAFNAKKGDEDFLVQFIDHDSKRNYHNKVTMRIHKSEDDEFMEIQYKKRYPVLTTIDDAIQQAEEEGIDGELEVEYGVNKKTLSVTHVVEIPVNAHILPALDKSHHHVTSEAPEIFEPFLTELDESTLVGPYEFERHTGKLNGYKIKLERWLIADEGIVELSSKVKTEEEAQELQQQLINYLKELNVYEATDQLKTELIFENNVSSS
ncbi:hypothetical protein [Macrococcus brunensis]|uniref:hypothetical protein n=1 Tax=Macrococcus brunensis TaxID=198483 RepID=UPI001EEFBAAC|nr:hypothetical protein [Macrococcus brunensis]ULG71897.1 hypothetical protein MGG12_11590 [Macrococcus brunensis]